MTVVSHILKTAKQITSSQRLYFSQIRTEMCTETNSYSTFVCYVSLSYLFIFTILDPKTKMFAKSHKLICSQKNSFKASTKSVWTSLQLASDDKSMNTVTLPLINWPNHCLLPQDNHSISRSYNLINISNCLLWEISSVLLRWIEQLN